ncbi:hypothetical protein DFH06DRAFT_1015000, partial [Mycena polygramma]
WIYQSSSEHLFWLPTQHRLGFWMPENTMVIGCQQTKLSYDSFVHGAQWAECYNPGGKPVNRV